MKLLIIGGSGVLSSAVVKEALNQKMDVTIVNRGNRRQIFAEGVHFIKADYHNKGLMLEKLKGLHFDAVIDFICFKKEQIAYSVDLLSPFADQYIFISSACVYNTAIPGKKNENSETVLKEWDYSVNKWDCEEYLRKVAAEKCVQYTIVRPCITYDDTRIPYGIMPPYGYHWTWIARLLAGKPIIRWDGGTAKWNMMRVEDFAVGVVGIIGNANAINEAFNICGDEICTWNEVVETVASHFGKDVVYFDISSNEYGKLCPAKKGEIAGRSLDAVIDNSKIKHVVPSYKMTLSLRDGIEKTICAYQEQKYQKGIDWKYDAECDRIISSIGKQKAIDVSQYKLGFVDYLQNASAKDTRTYWLELHRDNKIVKMFMKMRNAFSRIVRK